jgi:hypothetical protein
MRQVCIILVGILAGPFGVLHLQKSKLIILEWKVVDYTKSCISAAVLIYIASLTQPPGVLARNAATRARHCIRAYCHE